ncbi:MAG: zinc-ribbon domain containing protein [Nitrososphaerales archaeon]
MKICLSILEKIERKLYKHYKELNIDSYDSFIDCNFEWACDTCLKDKKAILANPSLQNYAWNPNLAYHDKELICRTCGANYKFTKEEKQLWYEKLKFWIDSEPVSCLNCRRHLRILKKENKTLSDILKKDEKEISIDELKTLSDIYRKWDKIEKAKFYDNLIRKKLRLQNKV